MALTKPPVLPTWADTGDKTQPSDAEITTGWPLSNIPPSRQRFNWLLNYLFNGVRYLTRRGMPEWAADENYMTGDRAQGPDGKTYVSLVDNNVNNTPATNPTKWTRWGHTASEVDQRIIDHVGLADPHPQYIDQPELDAAFSAHLAATDPHPVYLTQDEGDARYAFKVGDLWLNAAIVSSSSNWTVPAGVSKIRAYAIGMGAPGTAGGNGLQNLTASGGYGGAGGAGGAGGGCAWGDVAVVPGQQIPVTIDAVNTLFGTYLTATAGVGRTNPGAGTVNAGVTNSGTATGGNGGSGAAWGVSNQSYPLSGGGGGGGASGSPLGAGKNGATGGVNSHPTYQPFGGGAGGWNTAGNLGNGGNATAIYRGAFNQYSDLLLMPCRSIISGQDGAVLGYGGGGGWMGGGGGGGGSSASVNSCSGSVGTIGGYGGGGGGGSGASMNGTTSGATQPGFAGGAAGPGCVVVFW